MIQIKRAYDAPENKDGTRLLIDPLWPRGVKKDVLQIEAWLKDVAPSKGLRQWFGHEPAKWREFQKRYAAELRKRPESWQALLETVRKAKVALVYAARDAEHNNAVALKRFLEEHL